MTRVAFIINGDSEPRHLENVERAVERLEESGYEVFVASPTRPDGIAADHYRPATRSGVQALHDAIGTQALDELVLYTTGHGAPGGQVVLQDAFLAPSALHQLINGFTTQKRTVITDLCYGGATAARFSADPKTLFISAGSDVEAVCCTFFAPYFWAPARQIPDLDHDDVITLQERYAYALQVTLSHRAEIQTTPSFIRGGLDYFDTGFSPTAAPRAPFAASITTVDSEAELLEQLKHVQPGQIAVIQFSAPWCQPCHDYSPFFDRLAAKGTGRLFFLRVETQNTDWMERYHVTGVPSVVLYSEGRFHRVEDRMNPLNEQIGLYQPVIHTEDLPEIFANRTADHGTMLAYALRKFPELFGPNFHAALATALQEQSRVRDALGELFSKAPERARVMLPAVIAAAAHSSAVASRLNDVAWKASQLFTKADVALLYTALTQADPDPRSTILITLGNLATRRPELFASGDVTGLLAMASLERYWSADSLALLFQKQTWPIPAEALQLWNDVASTNSNLGRALLSLVEARPELALTIAPLIGRTLGGDTVTRFMHFVQQHPEARAVIAAELAQRLDHDWHAVQVTMPDGTLQYKVFDTQGIGHTPDLPAIATTILLTADYPELAETLGPVLTRSAAYADHSTWYAALIAEQPERLTRWLPALMANANHWAAARERLGTTAAQHPEITGSNLLSSAPAATTTSRHLGPFPDDKPITSALVAAAQQHPWARVELQRLMLSGDKNGWLNSSEQAELAPLLATYPQLGWALNAMINRHAIYAIYSDTFLPTLLQRITEHPCIGVLVGTLAKRYAHLFTAEHVATLRALAAHHRLAAIALRRLEQTRPDLFVTPE